MMEFIPTIGDVMREIEMLLKANHIIILGDFELLSYIEHAIYMNGNNDEFKLFTGGFSNDRKIATIAVVKKRKELRELLGIDDNTRWKYLLCVCQDKPEGFHMLRLDGVYEIPKWGKTKSIRSLLNCIFTCFEVTDQAKREWQKFRRGNNHGVE